MLDANFAESYVDLLGQQWRANHIRMPHKKDDLIPTDRSRIYLTSVGRRGSEVGVWGAGGGRCDVTLTLV